MKNLSSGRPPVHHITVKPCAKCGKDFTMADVGVKFPSHFAYTRYCSAECRGRRLRPLKSDAEIAQYLKANGAPQEDGCVTWMLKRNRNGYGCFENNGLLKMAHREAYRLAKGEIPPGLLVMHSCDNPACINPDHLSVGTHSDNMRDCVAKGRHNLQRQNRYRAAGAQQARPYHSP